jgi:hypothetical protein
MAALNMETFRNQQHNAVQAYNPSYLPFAKRELTTPAAIAVGPS